MLEKGSKRPGCLTETAHRLRVYWIQAAGGLAGERLVRHSGLLSALENASILSCHRRAEAFQEGGSDYVFRPFGGRPTVEVDRSA